MHIVAPFSSKSIKSSHYVAPCGYPNMLRAQQYFGQCFFEWQFSVNVAKCNALDPKCDLPSAVEILNHSKLVP